MDFTKIKSNGKEVHLEWTTPAEKDKAGGLVHHKLTSADAPEPAFTESLQAFRPEVLRLLELPEAYGEGLTVIGLSINHEEDGRLGLVVTSLKALAETNAPLVLNTPHLREASDEDTGAYLPSAMLRLLKAAAARATEYVHGTRAQASLFPSEGIRHAAQEFRDSIRDGVSVTLSTQGEEGVTLHGRKPAGRR